MKKFLSILLAAMMVLTMGTVAFAADEETAAADLVAVAEEEAASLVADVSDKAAEATASADDLISTTLETVSSNDLLTIIKDTFAKVKEDIDNLTIENVLSLPTNIMDDIVTGIFSALKALGVDVDAIYEKLSSSKIINWFASFYKGTALTTTAAQEVEDIPATGSTASIAAFATLSLAAAAAFVCYKKKEA